MVLIFNAFEKYFRIITSDKLKSAQLVAWLSAGEPAAFFSTLIVLIRGSVILHSAGRYSVGGEHTSLAVAPWQHNTRAIKSFANLPFCFARFGRVFMRYDGCQKRMFRVRLYFQARRWYLLNVASFKHCFLTAPKPDPNCGKPPLHLSGRW